MVVVVWVKAGGEVWVEGAAALRAHTDRGGQAQSHPAALDRDAHVCVYFKHMLCIQTHLVKGAWVGSVGARGAVVAWEGVQGEKGVQVARVAGEEAWVVEQVGTVVVGAVAVVVGEGPVWQWTDTQTLARC